LTWSVNPRYKLNDDQMVYARVATGYRPGGVSLVTQAALSAGIPPIFKPDHLTNYEVGWKAALFDRRVTLDIDAYYIRWTDVQEQVVLGSFTFLSNAGRAHSEGVEASFTWTPINALKLALSGTYNDNRLDNDAQSNQDIAQTGHRLPLTPRFSGQFNADYRFPLATELEGFAGLSVFATMARPNALSLGYDPNKASGEGAVDNFGLVQLYDPNTGAPAGYARNVLPGYATLDLRAGVIHGAWTLEAYAKNVTDAHAYTAYAGLNNASFGNLSSIWAATILPPRTVGLSLSMKF
jgi:outer membrane receptor protein involved in Fe transport